MNIFWGFVLIGMLGGNPFSAVSTWREVSGLPERVELLDVTSNGSVFVTVGVSGLIQVSHDGINWQTVDLDITADVTFVDWMADGRFAALAGESLLFSSDGLTWEEISTSPHLLKSIVSDGQRLTATTSYETLFSTNHGADWQVLENNRFRDVAWNGDSYVGVLGTKIYTSPDGIHWEHVASGPEIGTTSEFYAVRYLGGRWFALGGWSQLPTSVFIFESKGYVFSSPDGVEWRQFDTESNFFTDMAQVGEAFGLIDWDGQFFLFDGETIGPVDSRTQPYVKSLASLGNVLLAVGDNGISRLEDDQWSFPRKVVPRRLKDMALKDGVRVVAAFDGLVLRTSDDRVWDSHYVGRAVRLAAIAVFDDRFIAVSEGADMFASSDGISWHELDFPFRDRLKDVFGEGDHLIVAGDRGVYHSNDAVSWQQISDSGARHIHWNGDTFAVAGYSFLTSSDGVTWTEEPGLWSSYGLAWSPDGWRQVIYEAIAHRPLTESEWQIQKGLLRYSPVSIASSSSVSNPNGVLFTMDQSGRILSKKGIYDPWREAACLPISHANGGQKLHWDGTAFWAVTGKKIFTTGTAGLKQVLAFPWVSANQHFESRLVITNAGPNEVTMQLTAQREDGSRENAVRVLSPYAVLRESSKSLFPAMVDGPGFSVVVHSTHGEISGSWLTGRSGTLAETAPGMGSAVDLGPAQKVGVEGLLFDGLDLSSELHGAIIVMNRFGSERVTVRFYDSDGQLMGKLNLGSLPPFRPRAFMVPEFSGKRPAYAIAKVASNALLGARFMFNDKGDAAIAQPREIPFVKPLPGQDGRPGDR